MPFSLNTFRYLIVSLLLLVSATCTTALASPALETSGTGFTLDVDGNGEQDALTDGLLIIRALFGFEEEALLAGAVSETATRSEIGDYIRANLQDLDIDGDGAARPLTDGLLIIRFLFGFEGEALVQGAVSNEAARATSQQLTNFLEQISDADNDGIVDFLENRAPVVTLQGASEITFTQGETLSDPGATADDREDGDLSENVVSDWDAVVQNDTPGTYTVTYQVADSEGETGVTQRIVIVQTSALAKLIGRWQLDGDGAASVGPVPGSDEWWSSTDEVNNSGPYNRPCWFDDVYEFTAGGAFLNEHGEETFLEDWQGANFECGVPVAPHDGSVSATYVLDESAQTIELIGRGAYIGLPKAVNGAELKSPTNAPESVTYQIDVLEEDQLAIYVQAGGNVHWTFRLRPWSENEQAQTVDVFEDWAVPTLEGVESPTAYDGYDLLFADEFDGTELDEANWTFDIGTGNSGWGNNESQFYTDRNVLVRDGVLTIRARSEDLAGRSYTSSRIKSQGRFDFQYGRVDVRAALPKGQGLWPAIWMLGANFTEVDWPMSGEIDIMELVGNNDQRVYGTAHWNNGGVSAPYSPAMFGKAFDLESGSFFGEYHVFSLIWTADKLTWLVDDEVYHEMALDDSANLAPFRKSFFLIMNVAVGGNWPGYPDPANDDLVFPQEMIVDYIRIFQPVE
jgi:beta-glucanase (GH16 family)